MAGANSQEPGGRPRELEQAAWLGRHVLLVAGRFDAVGSDPGERAADNGADGDIECRSFQYFAPGPIGVGARAGALGAIAIPGAVGSIESLDPLVLESGGQRRELPPAELAGLVTDLRSFVRHWVAPLDAETRSRALHFLATSAGAAGGMDTSETLFALRQTLRERRPIWINGPGRASGFSIDKLLAIDEQGFYVRGWMYDEDAPIVRLTAISPEGARVELLDGLFRLERPDVRDLAPAIRDAAREPGFHTFFELEAPSRLMEGWLFEVENADGAIGEASGPVAEADMETVRQMLLWDPFSDGLPNDELMSKHVHPAISRIQQRIHDRVRVERVTQFGRPPDAPEVSVVVPIYKRIDHLEMQLAEFADDPELKAADLIYVLDSPEQGDAFSHLAAELFPIYEVPLRIAVLAENVGFAGANNAGASLARGRLLALVNSDVVPARPGWLGAMQSFYDSAADIGCLGPKLLYEDDSIQHAGMYMHRQPGSSYWLDAHYFKGLHRTFPAAGVTRSVPAVSGACLMISRELYERFGLRGIYVRGDYEDFDLCLRLLEAGYANWVLPEVELYHLEAQSYTSELRAPANRYNMWLHTTLWRERIEELMERFDLEGVLGQGTGAER